MTELHATAIVSAGARLGENVVIGPYCVVGPDVELGDGVRLTSHVVVAGRTRIGPETQVYPFASIGQPPQDLKYAGEPSELVVGARNRIREHVTMNPGTRGDKMVTRTGDDCLFMVAAHVAHDCVIGDHVIMSNNATLGGHVEIGDYAIIGGLAAIHQYVRIGKHAMIGGMSGIKSDVIPYGQVHGEEAQLRGLNLIGLRRRGFSSDEVHDLRVAYRMLFALEGTLAERIEDVLQKYDESSAVRDIVDFIRADNSRKILQPEAGD